MPELSVIIPLFNKAKDIDKTIHSVLNQSFDDFELIIVDDGSTDTSIEAVKQFDDARIQLFLKQNEGVAFTRNYGVNKSNTQLIVFLDADDYWHVGHLENLFNLNKKFPNQRWFASAYEKKYSEKHIAPMVSPILAHGKNWNGIVDNYFKNSLIDALAWTSAIAIKKDFYKELGGFDTKITHGAGEDTDLWLRAALKSPLVFSNTITATYNLIGTNRISKTPTRKRNFMDLDQYEMAANTDPFLKKYLDLNRFSMAIKHKLAGDTQGYRAYTEKLNQANLNSKQRLLLKLPKFALKMLLRSKYILEGMGIRYSSFK